MHDSVKCYWQVLLPVKLCSQHTLMAKLPPHCPGNLEQYLSAIIQSVAEILWPIGINERHYKPGGSKLGCAQALPIGVNAQRPYRTETNIGTRTARFALVKGVLDKNLLWWEYGQMLPYLSSEVYNKVIIIDCIVTTLWRETSGEWRSPWDFSWNNVCKHLMGENWFMFSLPM